MPSIWLPLNWLKRFTQNSSKISKTGDREKCFAHVKQNVFEQGFGNYLWGGFCVRSVHFAIPADTYEALKIRQCTCPQGIYNLADKISKDLIFSEDG